MKKTRILIVAFLALFTACQKDEDSHERVEHAPVGHNAFVLNEGIWGLNEATISLVNLDDHSIDNEYFESCNGRTMGDVGQDLVVYGSKAYATINNSNNLEVVDLKDGSARHIDLGTRSPRYIAACGGMIYITCYSPCSVIRIDTATLQIEGSCMLGAFKPEGICFNNGKLYVASAWIQNESGGFQYDNTLYVIDPLSFSITDTLTTGYNAEHIIAFDDSHIAVACKGDYSPNNLGRLDIVDCASGNIIRSIPRSVMNLDSYQGDIYCYTIDYDQYFNAICHFYRIDGSDLTVTEILSDSGIDNPYGINVNPFNGNIFVTTDGHYSSCGDIHCFSNSGTKLWQLEGGMLPKKVVVF